MANACLDDDFALLLAEGRASSEQRASVREHLAGCPHCAELIAEVLREERTDSSARTFEEVGIRGNRHGDVLGKRWRLVHWIGAGRTGSVWEAEDTQGQLGRCALKVVAASAEERRRFDREARLLFQVTDPNIVRAYDAFETDDALVLVLEMLDGEALATRLARSGAVSFDDGVGILRAVARALSAAHQRGIVHRDLKPSNVFVSQSRPRIRLLDLGLAAPTDAWSGDTLTNITVTGSAVGTPVYMAPEQLFREPEAARSPLVDVWALGLLAHEMLVGSLPFELGPLGKLLRAVRDAPFAPLSARASLPDALDHLVLRWLALDPAERGDSATAFRDLEVIAREHGVDDEW